MTGRKACDTKSFLMTITAAFVLGLSLIAAAGLFGMFVEAGLMALAKAVFELIDTDELKAWRQELEAWRGEVRGWRRLQK